jgi:hypothetical protein
VWRPASDYRPGDRGHRSPYGCFGRPSGFQAGCGPARLGVADVGLLGQNETLAVLALPFRRNSGNAVYAAPTSCHPGPLCPGPIGRHLRTARQPPAPTMLSRDMAAAAPWILGTKAQDDKSWGVAPGVQLALRSDAIRPHQFVILGRCAQDPSGGALRTTRGSQRRRRRSTAIWGILRHGSWAQRPRMTRLGVWLRGCS